MRLKLVDKKLDGLRWKIFHVIENSLKSDDEKVDIIYNVEPELIAPIEIGQNVGKADIYVDKQYYCSVPLITNTAVEKIDYKYIFNQVIDKFLLFGTSE